MPEACELGGVCLHSRESLAVQFGEQGQEFRVVDAGVPHQQQERRDSGCDFGGQCAPRANDRRAIEFLPVESIGSVFGGDRSLTEKGPIANCSDEARLPGEGLVDRVDGNRGFVGDGLDGGGCVAIVQEPPLSDGDDSVALGPGPRLPAGCVIEAGGLDRSTLSVHTFTLVYWIERGNEVTDPSVVLGRLLAATNDRDLDRLVDCFSEDYVNETPAHPDRSFRGNAQVRRNWAQIFQFVSDLRATVVASSVTDDEVWSEWEMRGTRPDGSLHLMRGVIIFGVADERISRARFYLEPAEDGGGSVDEFVRSQVGAT